MSLLGLNICVIGGGIGGLTAAIALASIAGGAHAADLETEVLQQAGVTPVEFGSGWYLRGDVGRLVGL